MTEHVSSRREVMKKVGVAGGITGVAWAAPRVSGLSLRPDHAAAQSGPGDQLDVPGVDVVLDHVFNGFVDGFDSTVLFTGFDAPVDGVLSAAVGIPPFGPPLLIGAFIAGPGVNLSCNINSVNADTDAPVVLGPSVSDVGASAQSLFRSLVGVDAPDQLQPLAPMGVHARITCT